VRVELADIFRGIVEAVVAKEPADAAARLPTTGT